MRIEPGTPQYSMLPTDEFPYTFRLSQLATVELPHLGDTAGWINIAYPMLEAKIYCSYLPITRATLPKIMEDNRELLLRQAQKAATIFEKEFSNPEEHVFGTLFLLDGDSPSPIQFTLTDSTSHFFRGALYYDSRVNADSIAPVTEYIQEDIIELIQSFRWTD